MRLLRRSSAPPSQSPSSSSFAFGIAVGGKKSMTTSAGSSSSVLAPLVADGLEEVPLLEALDDNHGGVIVGIKNSMDHAAFTSSLRASLADWRKKVHYFVRLLVSLKLPVKKGNKRRMDKIAH